MSGQVVVHYREQDQEHPGIAACCIPPNHEWLTRNAAEVTCPKCIRLMRAWGILE